MSEQKRTGGKPREEQSPEHVDEAETAEGVQAAEGFQPQESPEIDSADADQSDQDGEQPLNDTQKVELLANQLAKAQEDVLRAQAESQNSRRRSEGEVEKARKFALERFVGDLLPVVDNLDRALGAIDQTDESFKSVVEGIELTRKSFLDTLTKYHVVKIDPVGEPFDPELHQAMAMVPNPDVEPNSVIEVFQKGYSLNGRLIRPAMVVVSKTPE